MSEEKDELIGWVIFDENPNDFMAGGDALIIPKNTNTKVYEYNQYTPNPLDSLHDTRWSCALFASMGAISDLTSYKFTDDDILKIQISAIENYGLIPGIWMYMSKAVDCVRNWWNLKFPEQKLISYRVTIWDTDFLNARELGHSLVVWYKISKEYALEQSKWEILSEDFPKNSGHLVRNATVDDTSYIRDNYFGRYTFNIYKNGKIIPLMKNQVYFPSAYLFLFDVDKKKEAEKEKVIILNKIREIIKRNKTKGINQMRTYFELRAYWYSKKYIYFCIREIYEMNIPDDMKI